MRILRLGLLGVALAAQPSQAGEILTYRTPDGGVGITDEPKLVPPGSEILRRDAETPRRDERIPDAAPMAPSQRNASARGVGDPDPDAAEAARWRQKLVQAHQDEQAAAHALELAERDYRSCRRREGLGFSSQTRIPGETSCDEAPVAAAQHDWERAKAYAEDGIEDECRRAGCLPGWLR